MKTVPWLITLILLCAAMYFLGKKNGTTQLQTKIIHNNNFVQAIAELAVLEANGQTNVKISNSTGDKGVWTKFKSFFTENTLQVTIPYTAKYGVKVNDGKIKLQERDSMVLVQLPAVKMLSLQLHLDKMQLMNQTGLLVHTTIEDLQQAQQQLYQAAYAQLSNDTNLLTKTKDQVSKVIADYYSPLGLGVNCEYLQ